MALVHTQNRAWSQCTAKKQQQQALCRWIDLTSPAMSIGIMDTGLVDVLQSRSRHTTGRKHRIRKKKPKKT
jgi:hypothetical protein